MEQLPNPYRYTELQLNLHIDTEIKDWLVALPRDINVSKLVRTYLHTLLPLSNEELRNL